MKKISLICAVALAGLSLTACGSNSTKKASSPSKASSHKIVKRHKHHKKQTKKVNKQSSSSSSSSSTSSQQQQDQQTQQSDQQATFSTSSQQGISEDQARSLLGGANGDLQASRTDNGWIFSGNGYTATVNDDGNISHN